ncbi:MAG: CCDC90 family protein [Candidatus Kuenenia sp.]|nr:CCDC90 family protein [Candidatus Kuenenia sp.]
MQRSEVGVQGSEDGESGRVENLIQNLKQNIGGPYMPSVTFDTLVYAKRLKKVGFTEAQAEAQTEAQVGHKHALHKYF